MKINMNICNASQSRAPAINFKLTVLFMPVPMQVVPQHLTTCVRASGFRRNDASISLRLRVSVEIIGPAGAMHILCALAADSRNSNPVGSRQELQADQDDTRV